MWRLASIIILPTFAVRQGSREPGEEALLRERLVEAAEVIGTSHADEAIVCKCEDYCTGRCFAASCSACDAATWSFPGGASMCLDAGPLGTGLLCRRDPATGQLLGKACCSSAPDGPCKLPPDSCCSSGSCKSCPRYPRQTIFPSLNDTQTRQDLRRSFIDAENTCKTLA
eukprot:TRINITY_DN97205_c0_g1_i1.p1 TRINITY_DN97205_c0_g1~~TRINITY_DN97205_c0_g1_i1.p1  ORF type:complete len:170 (-),score=31.72 TRINITY_DN97205_c0_g1_i1:85-594(-)